jgi:hypothetical protein
VTVVGSYNKYRLSDKVNVMFKVKVASLEVCSNLMSASPPYGISCFLTNEASKSSRGHINIMRCVERMSLCNSVMSK